MGDIELVIKMPEEMYQHYKKVWQKRRGSMPESCIAFGIQLPKGHSKLIDADALIYKAETCIETTDAFIDLIKNAPPIIEADKG